MLSKLTLTLTLTLTLNPNPTYKAWKNVAAIFYVSGEEKWMSTGNLNPIWWI